MSREILITQSTTFKEIESWNLVSSIYTHEETESSLFKSHRVLQQLHVHGRNETNVKQSLDYFVIWWIQTRDDPPKNVDYTISPWKH